MRTSKFIVSAISLAMAGPALGVIYYVDIDAPNTGTGTTNWSNASNDLVGIWNNAVEGDEIRVATGIYLPDASIVTFSFEFTDQGVTVLGGYPGYLTADPDARDIVANPTTLSGDLSGSLRSHHIIQAINRFNLPENNCVVDGFIIDGGAAISEGGHGENGGGALIIASGVNFIRCRFSNNGASDRGGAVYVEDGPHSTEEDPDPDPDDRCVCFFINCVFDDNGAAEGGAIADVQGKVIIHNGLFLNNTASAEEDAGKGGGFSPPPTRRASPPANWRTAPST